MGFRFRRSVKIAPGLRLNFGTRGMSLSAGVRGASVTVGRTGVYGNVGLPGTGLSYRTRLDGGGGRRVTAPRASAVPALPPGVAVPDSVRLTIHATGSVLLTDASGAPLPPEVVRAVLAVNGPAIFDALEAQAATLNAAAEELARVHLATPAPWGMPAYQPLPFALPKPEKPEREEPGMIGKFFGGTARAEERFQAAMAEYMAAIGPWRAQQADHDRIERARAAAFLQARTGDPDAMGTVLESRLEAIEWPRETSAAFEVRDAGRTLLLDVDLPEIEDLPAVTYKAKRDQLDLEARPISETQRRKTYMTHVHAIGIRLLGEAFAALPTVQRVVLGAYSQRTEPATGRVRDEYLYSVRMPRVAWGTVHFGNLAALDVVDALALGELRRDMTKTGIFRPVPPFAD